ncbi:Uncharacterized protein dnm_043210 [Desulfonema magnum]|uniref:Uncharacterized protein n=1 Tax=Desulfonema magnum TaxID=45655 RepID=A0A975BM87_9BACT|nr:Uncharacterized protein dnm_043210 [Desulfonema magnum]
MTNPGHSRRICQSPGAFRETLRSAETEEFSSEILSSMEKNEWLRPH